jgi:hypothetical protein
MGLWGKPKYTGTEEDLAAAFMTIAFEFPEIELASVPLDALSIAEGIVNKTYKVPAKRGKGRYTEPERVMAAGLQTMAGAAGAAYAKEITLGDFSEGVQPLMLHSLKVAALIVSEEPLP